MDVVDSKSLYQKVVDTIKEDIKNNKLPPKLKLPSEPELAKRLGVSRATLREALIMLESENIIKRVHGIGTFVRGHALIESGIEELTSITELIIQNGQTPGTSFYMQEVVNPDEETRARLNMEDGETIRYIKRIRTANDDPVIYCIDHIPTKYFKDEYEFSEGSLFIDMENASNIEVEYAVSHIEACGYHPEISPALNSKENLSLLVLKQMHYDTLNRPVLYSENYFRSDVFSFTVLRTKK